MNGLRGALAFLTRLPVAHRTFDIGRSLKWFPLVGLLVGALVGATFAAFAMVLPASAAAVLAVLAGVVLTGGLHEDGLADCADAVGAHVSTARKGEILDDPTLGTYGTLAIVFAVLFPVLVLAPLDSGDVVAVAIAAHGLARLAILVAARSLSPSRCNGSAAALSPGLGPVIASGIVVVGAVVAAVGPGAALTAVIAGALVGGGVLVLLVRTLGFANGDVFGAVTKTVELAVYGALSAALA